MVWGFYLLDPPHPTHTHLPWGQGYDITLLAGTSTFEQLCCQFSAQMLGGLIPRCPWVSLTRSVLYWRGMSLSACPLCPLQGQDVCGTHVLSLFLCPTELALVRL